MPSLVWTDIALCWFAMAAHALWCSRIDSQLARSWVGASLRAALQLSALSYLLSFLFERDSVLWSGLAVTVMMVASAWTVAARAGVSYRNLLADCAVSVALALVIAVLPLALWMHERNFLEASFFVPFIGILLGNSISGLSLGIAQWHRELRHRREEIEFWVAVGATPRESVQELETSVMKTAMTVVLNSMAISGLVSIPGQMSGQLLAGGSPELAVRYQLAVLFLISCVVFSSTWILLRRSLRRAFDPWGAPLELERAHS